MANFIVSAFFTIAVITVAPTAMGQGGCGQMTMQDTMNILQEVFGSNMNWQQQMQMNMNKLTNQQAKQQYQRMMQMITSAMAFGPPPQQGQNAQQWDQQLMNFMNAALLWEQGWMNLSPAAHQDLNRVFPKTGAIFDRCVGPMMNTGMASGGMNNNNGGMNSNMNSNNYG